MAENEKFWAEHPDFKVLSYLPEIKDVQVADGVAIEWGYFGATYELSQEAPPLSYRGQVLRVLRRESDGSWKLARVCENSAGQP
jgi:ketosteroid isomerase-like protein